MKKIFEKINNLKISICNDLAVAVNQAFDQATAGDIVLLSPSCSSHDMYQNYIERGEHFNKIVRSLKNWKFFLHKLITICQFMIIT